jgi:hypothetical protein
MADSKTTEQPYPHLQKLRMQTEKPVDYWSNLLASVAEFTLLVKELQAA